MRIIQVIDQIRNVCNSNMLFQVSLVANLGCIFVAVIAACLISVDLIYWSPENNHYLKVRETSQSVYIHTQHLI